MLDRVVVPSRLALIRRGDKELGYNPAVNSWERLRNDTSEVLRWLRAGRDRTVLHSHLIQRFGYSAAFASQRLREILVWCIFRQLLYLDREPAAATLTPSQDSLDTVYWSCTQACNLRCTYCYQGATVPRSNELSTQEAKELVDQAVEVGASTFIFTGGEPFTRQDLFEVAQYSKSRGLRSNVITNGHFITPANIDKVRPVVDNVTVSLDHGIPEHHDRHRGLGSWSRAAEAIDLLLGAGVPVDINSVVTRSGYEDIAELVRFARQRRIGEQRIIPQFPMGRGNENRGGALDANEIMGLNDKLYVAGCKLDDEGQARISVEGTYNARRVLRNHCGAGLGEVAVDSEGWVYPCKLLQHESFRADTIRKRRLVDIVKEHEVFKRIRAAVATSLQPCRTCVIRTHCGGGCRGIHFSFTHDYVQTHPLFCAYLRSSFELQAWFSTGEVPSPRNTEFRSSPSDDTTRSALMMRVPCRSVQC